MFYGEYEHTLDNKGRLIIPSKFRETLSDLCTDKFYITRGLDKCLFVFTEDEWRVQEQKFRSMSFTKPDARKFNRLFFSGAAELVCDKQGRILVPQYLTTYADIAKDVMIVGVADRFEIWDKSKWQAFYDESKDSFEDLAENLFNE